MRALGILALLLASANAAADALPRVALCDLLTDRATYNHQLIEVSGFVSHGFEDFTLFDPRCESDASPIWLEYGGTLSSGTIYCCGVDGKRTRSAPLVVEGIPIGLARDETLKKFDALLQANPDTLVRATIRGHFFSGQKQQWPRGTVWAGYGHFGVHSLLAIEQVVAVEPHDLPNIDYRSVSDQPSLGDEVCFIRPIGDTDHPAAIQQQRQAESGAEGWRFRDHHRVALEALAAVIERPIRLETVKQMAGRVVYRAAAPSSRNRYRVVVSRPYWLTSTAARRGRIAWVSIAVFEYGCDEKNQ